MRVPRAYFEWARDEFENLPAAARHEGHAPPEDCIVIAGVDIFPED